MECRAPAQSQLRQQEMARLLGTGRPYTLSGLASILGCGISTAHRDRENTDGDREQLPNLPNLRLPTLKP